MQLFLFLFVLCFSNKNYGGNFQPKLPLILSKKTKIIIKMEKRDEKGQMFQIGFLGELIVLKSFLKFFLGHLAGSGQRQIL